MLFIFLFFYWFVIDYLVLVSVFILGCKDRNYFGKGDMFISDTLQIEIINDMTYESDLGTQSFLHGILFELFYANRYWQLIL